MCRAQCLNLGSSCSCNPQFPVRPRLARDVPTGRSMASPALVPASRMRVPVLGLRRDRQRDSATGGAREVPTREGSRQGRSSFDDVYDAVVVVCFLSLIGLVVFGGAWMCLSKLASVLPVSPRIACAEFDGCVVAGPDANKAVVVDEPRTDEPTLTR